MEATQKSMTALAAAYARAHHHLYDAPKIVDDPIAPRLIVSGEREILESAYLKLLERLDPSYAMSGLDRSTMVACAMQSLGGVAEVLERSRYAEDVLAETVRSGVRQYVQIGAGMDTFVFRQLELNQALQVFEVDLPAMQAFKRQRLAEVDLELPAHTHQIPLDLEHESLAAGLRQSGYDLNVPAFFAWLGVTPYIDRASFFKTLQDIYSLAPRGSSVVFDYFDTDAYVPEKSALRMQLIVDGVRGIGESINTGFDPHTLALDLSKIGFRLVEHLSPDDLQERYFATRTDGYYACEHAHLAWAVVE